VVGHTIAITTKEIPYMSRTKAIAFSAVGGAVAALMTANIAFADGRGFGGGFGGRRRGEGLMLFFPLLLLTAVAVLLVVLWRGRHPATPATSGPPAPPASPTLNAQAILADRLARGEISPDDYRSAITVLRENPPPPVG
jgi:putative membrane protein